MGKRLAVFSVFLALIYFHSLPRKMVDEKPVTSEAEEGPVFIAYSTENMVQSPRELYKSVKEVHKFVNSPEGKGMSARFKKFGTPREALDFLSFGDVGGTPNLKTTAPPAPAEPNSPFSGVTRPQMNELKRYIEKGDMENFLRLIDTNPRFLVNTGGDVASIVMEGFRYNVFHIAAKAGQVEIIGKVLDLLNDIDFLTRLYGTSREDVANRQRNIVDSYLNTPDKANWDTPMHFAAKFGNLAVVKTLAAQQLLDKTAKNKMEKTALESACERYNSEDKVEIVKEMKLAMEGYFVFLTRDENGVSQLTVAQNQCSLPPPSAIAGPFFTHSDANDFRTKWTAVGKEVKRSDFDKGYEKVGRLLASQNPSVEWRETWKFLGDDAPPIDVTSEAGLIMLESVLGKRQKDEMILRSQPRIQPARTADFGKTSVRRTLNFDILDDELTPPSTSSSPSSADVSEEENEEFFDTFTEIQDESLLDDTLGSLTGRFAAMSVISPKREEVVESLSLALNSDEDENEDDVDSFFTPPSSPPPMFVIDEAPCKAPVN